MNKKVIIIAEAGVNHNGNIEMAKQLIDVAVNAGALDIEEGEEEYYIETETTDLHTVDKALIAAFGEHESSNFIWKPVIEATELSPELQTKFDKIIDSLEDIDDIQTVYHN